MTADHEGMRKAPMEGKSELDRLGTGGIGGSPGVGMWDVSDGSSVGALLVCGTGPGPGVELPLVLLWREYPGAGGE